MQLNTNLRWGGGEQQILDLMHGSDDLGVRSTLIARPGGELFRRARAEGCAPIPFDFLTPWNPLAFARLCRTLRRVEADVLHVHDSRALALGVPAAMLLGLRAVVHRRISSPIRRNLLSRRLYRARCIDAYIAVSESARRTLLDVGVPCERTQVIPSGVNTSRLQPLTERQELRHALGFGSETWIGTVSALDRKKDVETFLHAAATLGAAHPGWRFLVVGNGPERRRLERLARELDLGDRVRFTGHVAGAHRYTAILDAFVFPSLREGSPGAIKEAMSLGVPVIAAKSPGTTEVLRPETGWLVPPRDPEALAGAVEQVLSRPSEAREKIDRARALVADRFPIGRTVEETVSLYRVIGQPRSVSATAS